MAVRTKQVETMIEEFNLYLKNNKIIDEYSNEVHLFIHLLMKSKCYQGFNWFYEYPYTDIMGKVTMIERLCGTSDYNKIAEMNGYIQLN